MAKILLVDDDPQSLNSTRKILEKDNHVVDVAIDGRDALEKVRKIRETQSSYDLLITDVRMPNLDGLALLKTLKAGRFDIPVLLMTAYGQIEQAVWAMKFGAIDFLTKPFSIRTMSAAVKSALNSSKRNTIQEKDIVGKSPEMATVFEEIHKIAQTDATVLIKGESGTGKELVARRIHQMGARSEKSWIVLNCAALPINLIEAELFGYEKGAFSGADRSKQGLIEAADGGTLFLDEIGDLPIEVQAKFLRVLQEGEVRPIGSTKSRQVDFRLISATHRDLKKMSEEGKFRSDLLFRIDVVSLNIPALRARQGDIQLLAEHFLAVYSKRYEKSDLGFSAAVLSSLKNYSWPGNVRELSNAIERAVIFSNGTTILESDLTPQVIKSNQMNRSNDQEMAEVKIPVGTSLKEVEDIMIRHALDLAGGNKELAADLLGINSRTVRRRTNARSKED